MDEMRRFAAAVFAPTDIIEIRMLPSRRSIWTTAAELTHRPEFDGQNVYVGANPRREKGGKDADSVAIARCLFVDIDGVTLDEAMDRLGRTGLPAPTAVVLSGGGVHMWWRLAEPMADLSAWTALQKAIIPLLGADKAIHDPPRIIRLPGTTNVKRGKPCTIAECEPSRVYRLDEFPSPGSDVLEQVIGARKQRETGQIGVPAGESALSRNTLLFLRQGAGEGERNTRLFSAACDYAGCGVPQDQAERDLLEAGNRCGLPDAEILSAVRSAYGKTRTPARPAGSIATPRLSDDQIESVHGVSGFRASEPTTARDVARQTAAESTVLSNVVAVPFQDDEGNVKVKLIYKGVEQIAAELHDATGGWPRRVGGVLFVVKDGGGVIAGGDSIWTFDSAEAMGAWMHTAAPVRWAGGRSKVTDAKGKETITPVSKTEVFAYLSDNARPNYRGVYALPHEPPMESVYYIPSKLPEGNGECLDEFVANLNAETDHDRSLMLAAILTPGWGGPCGARPAFVFCSDHGQGSGKSATVQAITDLIWGGALTIDPKDNWEQVIKRLLGDAGLGIRCAVMDNVVGKIANRSLEGLLTAKTIDGWRPFYGQFSRPNDLTYYVTSNTPRLTRDLADRSIVVKIGPPKHAFSFVDWAQKFVSEHRAMLLADIYARLRAEPIGEVSRANRSRWQAWEDGVLARVAGADTLAQLAAERRGDVDDDSEDAAAFAEHIRAALTEHGLTDGKVLIGRQDLCDWLIARKAVEPGCSPKKLKAILDRLRSSRGPLAALREHGKHGSVRKWEWHWDVDAETYEPDISDIPV